ncbi:MAG: GNAT family N-acetyltransferase [Bacillota bacterium]|nr:GNAT family N-acetyltransferase [Bacillota bacterium]
MIKKCSEKDRSFVMDYISEEPSINLFMIGDIEAFGFERDFQEIWAEFDERGFIQAVLLRFHQSFIFYSKGEFDIFGFASIMGTNTPPIVLSGKSDIVSRFETIEGLSIGNKREFYFAECLLNHFFEETHIAIKKATVNDVDRIIDLRKSIEEFHVKEDAAKILKQSMESKTGRTYYTEENGIITACVSTTAENSLSAMIVGVCTKKENRRQGLATSIMQKLFKEVLSEGKVLCLFYDNPEAGRIYKRLGFKDIGKWTMYS